MSEGLAEPVGNDRVGPVRVGREVRLARPVGLDGLVCAQAQAPAPTATQILIRVRAAALNYRDLLVAKGTYPGRPGTGLNLVPLSDGAGEVVAVGSCVSRIGVGDRVSANCMIRWTSGPFDRSYVGDGLGMDHDGFLADYAVVDESAIVKIPEHLTFEEAASLPCAGVTAWRALMLGPQLLPGQTVLVLGSGGVSLFALQFAKLFGARVIATTSAPAKAEKLTSLGADAVVNYRETPEWAKEVLAHTAGQGVDRVIEIGGAGTLQQSMRATRAGGCIALVGYVTGRANAVDLAALPSCTTLMRTAIGSREDFEALLQAMGAHAVHPVIGRVFPFEEFGAAYSYLESGDHVGKVVIRMS